MDDRIYYKWENKTFTIVSAKQEGIETYLDRTILKFFFGMFISQIYG